MTKKEIKRTELWETWEMSLRCLRRLLAHQNWAWEPKAGPTRSPISSHYLTNTICRREWTLRPVDICDTERNLSPFSLSGSASTWTFSALLNGTDSNTRIRCLPVHGVATCFISSCPFQWPTHGSTPAWSRPVPSNHKEWLYCSRGGDFPGCYSWGSR